MLHFSGRLSPFRFSFPCPSSMPHIQARRTSIFIRNSCPDSTSCSPRTPEKGEADLDPADLHLAGGLVPSPPPTGHPDFFWF